MLNLIYAEILKLEKIKLLIRSLFFSVFWVIISLITHRRTWDIYMSESEDIMFLLIGTVLFILICSQVFISEYSNNTMGVLYSYPVSRISILICKAATIMLIITAVYVLNFLIITAGGIMVFSGMPPAEVLLQHLRANMTSLLLQFSLVPVVIFVVNTLKRGTASALFSMFALGTSGIMYIWGKYIYCPFSIAYMPFLKLQRSISVDLGITVRLALGIFILGSVLSAYQFSKISEV